MKGFFSVCSLQTSVHLGVQIGLLSLGTIMPRRHLGLHLSVYESPVYLPKWQKGRIHVLAYVSCSSCPSCLRLPPRRS